MTRFCGTPGGCAGPPGIGPGYGIVGNGCLALAASARSRSLARRDALRSLDSRAYARRQRPGPTGRAGSWPKSRRYSAAQSLSSDAALRSSRQVPDSITSSRALSELNNTIWRDRSNVVRLASGASPSAARASYRSGCTSSSQSVRHRARGPRSLPSSAATCSRELRHTRRTSAPPPSRSGSGLSTAPYTTSHPSSASAVIVALTAASCPS